MLQGELESNYLRKKKIGIISALRSKPPLSGRLNPLICGVRSCDMTRAPSVMNAVPGIKRKWGTINTNDCVLEIMITG